MPHRFALLLALCACSADPQEARKCTITDIKTDGSIGGRWNAATSTLAYGRAGADGHFKAYLSDADGNNERRITSAMWPEDRHQFVVEWHPSGKYLFVEVEKATHPGSSNDAIPGYGAYTDLWLVTRDGAQAWKLVDLPNDYDHALTHATITPDGTKLVWTERVKQPQLFDSNLAAGAYVFNMADFVDGPVPHLENIQSYDPGGGDQGGEVDGISDDGHTIAFYSTYVTKDLFKSRIYTWNVDTSAITELTTDSFSQAPRFTPSGSALVYMSGSQADIFPGDVQGADWWTVRPDGTGRRRLTFMNKWGDPQSVDHYRLAGVISFDSDVSFYGDVMTQPLGLTGKVVKVTCDSL
jgi:Tol biopolymer transport system component